MCDALGTPQRRDQKGITFYLKDYVKPVNHGEEQGGGKGGGKEGEEEGRQEGWALGHLSQIRERSSSQLIQLKPKTFPLWLGQFTFLGIRFSFSLR